MRRLRSATLTALVCLGVAGPSFASDYNDRYGQQVAGTLDIHWEIISGPPGAPVGCTAIEFTDGTLADAADATVNMVGTGVSIGGCAGIDSYTFTMAPDGLSLTGFASAVPMTLTRLPGEAAFVGDWVAQGYVYRAHIAADPFPVPDYDPTWLGEWIGEWTDLNDPEFLGSVEMVVEEVLEDGPASFLFGTLTWDCLFGEECGAAQQFQALEFGGAAEVSATNESGIENFTDGQYQFLRSADGLTVVGERLDDPWGREIRLTLRRVAAVAVPSESPSIQSAVDAFAMRPNALRLEVAPGTYNENVSLAAFAGRTARTDLVGTGGTPGETVIDDGVPEMGDTILATDGAGSLGLMMIENLTVTGGNTTDATSAGFEASAGDRSVVVRGCELRGNTTVWSGGTNNRFRRGANATLAQGARARFDSTTMADGSAEIAGGGLYVTRGDVVVVDCDIVNNTAANGGGATLDSEFLTGAGETAFFLRTRFQGNSSTSTGGAMFIGSYSNTTIEDCEFADNVTPASTANGGAINSVSPQTFTLRRTTFVRNVAGDSGGAINLSARGTHVIEDCTFGGAPGDGNRAGFAGGGIVIRSAYVGRVFDVDLSNSSFRDNQALYGGGIALVETATTAYPPPNPPFPGVRINLALSDLVLESNRASSWGGGMYAERDAADSGALSFVSCDFVGNTAAIGGGLFRNTGGSTEIDGGIFDGNDALDLRSGGGGIYLTRSAIDMKGVEFTSNTGGYGGAAVLIDAAGSSVAQCVFGIGPDRGNTSTVAGGALYAQTALDPAARSAAGRLAPIGLEPVALTVASSLPTRDVATDTDAVVDPEVLGLDPVDGIESDDARVRPDLARRAVGDPITVTDSVFEANSSEFGGGLIHWGATTLDADLLIERVEFRDNTANEGGGLYSLGYDDELIANSVEFRGNSAVFRGGAVSISSGTSRFANGLFFDNVVTNDQTGSEGPFGGGALSVGASDTTYRGAATLINSSVVGNRVDGAPAPDVGGGGLLVSGDVVVYNSILHGNDSPTPSVEAWQIELDPTAVDPPTVDVRNTIVEGWDPLGSPLGPGPIFDQDPAFQDEVLGDLRPTAGSFAINAGDVALLPIGLTVDLDGNLRVVDTGVDLGPYEFGVVTAVGDGPNTPRASDRMSLHPNPFNPRLSISFTIDRAQDVRVSIFDVRGRLVRVVQESSFSAGAHALEWDGKDAAGRQAASGNYMVELRAGDWRDVRSAVLVK